MKMFLFPFILFICFSISEVYAQLPYTFTNTAHNDHYGSYDLQSIAIDTDGTIFLLSHSTSSLPRYSHGLHAYSFINSKFTNTAYKYIEDEYPAGISIGTDGTIFLFSAFQVQIKRMFRLSAYTYDGSSFTLISSTDFGEIKTFYSPMDLVLSNDNTLFFIVADTLRAFSYDGSNFTNTANIKAYGNSFYNELAIGSDNTIFVATGDSLRAFSYDGLKFTNTTNISDGGAAVDITIGSDGTIFLATEYDGLRAYTYDGSSFNNTAHENETEIEYGIYNVVVGSDGTIIAYRASSAYAYNGLLTYSYNGNSFSLINEFQSSDNHPITGKMIAGTNKNLFLVAGGLHAYTYTDTSLTNHDNIYEGGYAHRVFLDSEGNVFLANGGGGLRVYTYDGSSFINIAQENEGIYSVYDVVVGTSGNVLPFEVIIKL